jgi:hypothetical protein
MGIAQIFNDVDNLQYCCMEKLHGFLWQGVNDFFQRRRRISPHTTPILCGKMVSTSKNPLYFFHSARENKKKMINLKQTKKFVRGLGLCLSKDYNIGT